MSEKFTVEQKEQIVIESFTATNQHCSFNKRRLKRESRLNFITRLR